MCTFCKNNAVSHVYFDVHGYAIKCFVCEDHLKECAFDINFDKRYSDQIKEEFREEKGDDWIFKQQINAHWQ